MDETAGLVDDEEVERCHLASSSCCLIGWLGWSEESSSRVESEQVVSPRAERSASEEYSGSGACTFHHWKPAAVAATIRTSTYYGSRYDRSRHAANAAGSY